MSGSYYVATNGNDANDGSAAHPFATLARAQAAMEASAIKTTTIEGGTYEIGNTISLTAADSGETWQAASGATVVIGGGEAVTGFTDQGNGVWAAATAPVTTDLTIGRVRALPADEGYDPSQPFTTGWRVVSQAQTQDTGQTFTIDPADLTAAVTVGAPIEVIDGYRYSSTTGTITAVDPVHDTITVSQPIDQGPNAGTSWRVLAEPSDLARDGTFAYDRITGTLLVKSVAAPTDVVAARLGTLFSGEGASNVTLRGLTFTDTTTPEGDYATGPAAITFQQSTDDSIVDDTFVNLGNGVDFNAVANSTIDGNGFRDLSGGAALIENASNANVVSGNTITDYGQIAIGATAVQISNSTTTTITDNLIDGGPAAAVGFNYATPLTGNVISGNMLLHTSEQTNDNGAIHAYAGVDAGYDVTNAVISDNRIESTGGLYRLPDGTYVPGDATGIYLDDHISNVRVSGNVVEGARDQGLFTHGGEDNAFLNNVVIVRSGLSFTPTNGTVEPDTGTADVTGSFTLPLLPGDIDQGRTVSTVTVEAAGAGARFTVRADGQIIGTGTAGAATTTFAFTAALQPGIAHTIAIDFTNGAADGSGPTLAIAAIGVNDALFGPNGGYQNGTGGFAGIGAQDDDLAVQGLTVEHNIVYAAETGHLGFGDYEYGHPNFVDATGTVDFNDYFNAPEKDLENVTFPSGTDQHSVSGDPLFADAATGDYTLASGSPAITIGFDQAGVPLTPDRVVLPRCLARGTRVAAARGEIPIEHLCRGDLVLTVEAGPRPIRRVVRQAHDPRAEPDPTLVAPIRVRAGALGPGTPARDLCLSPDHALWIDGALVPVRLLVNGASIARENADRVEYFHIELDRHATILAEGARVETLRAEGQVPCARLLTDPALVAPLWRRLAAAPLPVAA